MADDVTQDENESLSVSWKDVTRFIRQLSHDLRNNLNAIELQSAYIAELATSEDLKAEIKSLREMVAALALILQKLSKSVGEVSPNPIPYPALDLVQDLRSKIERDLAQASREVSWKIEVGDEMLHVDPQLLEEAFIEVFSNAFEHGRGKEPVVASARREDNRFVFTIREPKAQFALSTDAWGREPLRSTSQRHYGLGLYRAGGIMAAHGGELHAEYDRNVSALVTTLTLPVSGA
jgi:K+-sensing histidine kinase KdpD